MEKVDRLLYNLNKYEIPLTSIELELTDYCSCRCIMCNHWKFKEKNVMSLDLIKYLNKSLLHYPSMESIVLAGGEPLNYAYLADAIKNLKSFSLGMLTSLNHNHRVEIDDNLFRSLTWLRVSVDGYTSKIYKKIRGVNKRDYVFNKILQICEYPKSFRLNYTVQPQNIEDIENIIRWCVLNNISIKFWLEHKFKKIITRKQILGLISKFESMSLKYEPASLVDFSIVEDLNRLSEKAALTFASTSNCFINKFHMIINTVGEVYPCCYLLDVNDNARIASSGTILVEKDNFNAIASRQVKRLDMGGYSVCSACDRYYRLNDRSLNLDRRVVFL